MWSVFLTLKVHGHLNHTWVVSLVCLLFTGWTRMKQTLLSNNCIPRNRQTLLRRRTVEKSTNQPCKTTNTNYSWRQHFVSFNPLGFIQRSLVQSGIRIAARRLEIHCFRIGYYFLLSFHSLSKCCGWNRPLMLQYIKSCGIFLMKIFGIIRKLNTQKTTSILLNSNKKQGQIFINSCTANQCHFSSVEYENIEKQKWKYSLKFNI